MKIGIFTDTYAPEVNGVATSTVLLREELRRRGHQVFIFTTTSPGAPANTPFVFRLPSVPLLVLPSRRVGAIYNSRLADMIRQTGLDVIHTQTEFSLGMFGWGMAHSQGIPHVHTYHTIYEDYTHYVTRGVLDGQTKKAVRLFTRRYCNTAQRVVVPSDKTMHLLLEYGVERPIDIIPTGIDIGHFDIKHHPREKSVALRSQLGIGPDDPVLMSIGRIAKEKNIQMVIKGLPPFLAKYPNARFVLVGDGPHAAPLRELAKEMGIANRVIFVGEKPREEIAQYYHMGDVFISASTSETQGLTYVEAMSASLPVAAKKDPCIAGLVEDGYSGFLFEEQDEIPIVLEKAFFDQALREKVIQNALSKAHENSVTTFGDRIERVYHTAIEDLAIAW